MLAELGHRTVIVDADSQCNLTGMVLGYQGPDQLEHFYDSHPDQNLYAGLAPAFESRPQLIQPVDCIPVDTRPDLYLLPGHIGIAEYEVTLGIAQELTGSIQTLQNLPGSIHYLIQQTADSLGAEFVLVDMSPGLGSVNQNLLATSDFFLVPSSPDFFSSMAIDSLARVLPRWRQWAQRASQLELLLQATYPFPSSGMKFLGTVIQKYRPRAGAPAEAFQNWIDLISQKVTANLVPALAANEMLLAPGQYDSQGLSEGYCLAQIADFNSLIAKSQEHQTPVFALTDSQLGAVGVVLEGYQQSSAQFHAIFETLAERVVRLTATDAAGN